MSGTLSVVATPIGNLGDMTPRAIDTLRQADRILAEDTRHSSNLLQHFTVQTKMSACHQHNERQLIDQVGQWLAAGQNIALISDAGTPLINDPGYPLVAAMRAQGHAVQVVPGPCALIAALSVSGLPCDHFTFQGFLPAKASARRQQLQELTQMAMTLVFYEAVHRIQAMLRDLVDSFGAERRCFVARELTKQYETHYAGTLASVADELQQNPDQVKGEFVVIVAGASPDPERNESQQETERVLHCLLAELPLKQAVRMAATLLGKKKNELYDYALTLRASSSGDENS